MALTKNAVMKQSKALDEIVQSHYETYERKIDKRLLAGERVFTYQINSRLEVEALNKLFDKYRKGGWIIELKRYMTDTKWDNIQVTGTWQFIFN